jgi:hypothetical protein
VLKSFPCQIYVKFVPGKLNANSNLFFFPFFGLVSIVCYKRNKYLCCGCTDICCI